MVQLGEVARPIGDVADPFVQPRVQACRVAADGIPVAVERVVAVVVALGERRMRPVRLDADGGDRHAGEQGAIRVGADDVPVHQLLDHDDDPLGGEGRLALDPDQAPDLDVALGVGALGVDDRDVGVERRNDRDLVVGRVGRGDPLDERVGRRQVRSGIRAERVEGEMRRPRHVSADHPEVAVLLDLQAPGLDGAPDGVERAHAGVPEPREDELPGAAGGHHLVVHQVRGQPGQGQVAPALADDLVPGRERDEVGEPLDRDQVPVMDVGGDGLRQRENLAGRAVSLRSRASPVAGGWGSRPMPAPRRTGRWRCPPRPRPR